MPECSPELLHVPKGVPRIEEVNMCSLPGRLCCFRTHHDRRQRARLRTWDSNKRRMHESFIITVLPKARIYAHLCFVTHSQRKVQRLDWTERVLTRGDKRQVWPNGSGRLVDHLLRVVCSWRTPNAQRSWRSPLLIIRLEVEGHSRSAFRPHRHSWCQICDFEITQQS